MELLSSKSPSSSYILILSMENLHSEKALSAIHDSEKEICRHESEASARDEK